MQMPGSIAAANLPFDDRPSDAAFGHVVFGRNATILRPLKDPPGMPTEDVLTLLESRILGLSVDRLTTAASDSTIRGNCKTCRGIGGFIETALPVSRK